MENNEIIELSELTTEEKKKKFDEFLEEKWIKMNSWYIGRGVYFPWDKETRDIYSFTVEKKWIIESFNFWDSINNSNNRLLILESIGSRMNRTNWFSKKFIRPSNLDFLYCAYFGWDYEDFIDAFWEESANSFYRQKRYDEQLERVLWKELCEEINDFIYKLQY